MIASMSTAVLSDELLDAGWQLPVPVRVSAGERYAWAWVWRRSELRNTHDLALDLSDGCAALSAGLRRTLADGGHLDPSVSLELSKSQLLKVHAALANNISDGAVVHVGPKLFKALIRDDTDSRRWLMIGEGISAPVEVRQAARDIDGVRCGLLLRTLIGASLGGLVQLTDVSGYVEHRRSRERSQRQTMFERGRPWRSALVVIRRKLAQRARWLDFQSERLLRALLRAPPIVVRATQAPIGDDVTNVVRLHPAMFTWLGIQPGMQVGVTWCGLTVTALALEDLDAYDAAALARVREFQAVERTVFDLPDGLPPHLVARLSLSVRRQLGVPGHTIVEVRRRVRPVVLAQLNQMTVPVAGIFLAGVAVSDLRGWPLVVGLAIVVVFGLAPLRRARPPKGLWP